MLSVDYTCNVDTHREIVAYLLAQNAKRISTDVFEYDGCRVELDFHHAFHPLTEEKSAEDIFNGGMYTRLGIDFSAKEGHVEQDVKKVKSQLERFLKRVN